MFTSKLRHLLEEQFFFNTTFGYETTCIKTWNGTNSRCNYDTAMYKAL